MGKYTAALRPKRFVLCTCALAQLSACHGVDYSTRRDNFNRDTRRSNDLAFVHFSGEKATDDPYSVAFSRDRVRRGYAVNAPLYDDGDGMKAHLTTSRTKEYNWFSGFNFTFEF